MMRHVLRSKMMSTPKKKVPKESVTSDKGQFIEKDGELTYETKGTFIDN